MEIPDSLHRSTHWNRLNPEKAKANAARYYEKTKIIRKEKAKQRYESNAELVRAMVLAGSGVPKRDSGDCCELCGRDNPGKGRARWCLDHDHETGLFRGWLCSSCNLGLGLLGDNLASLERAVDYLRRNI